ncbi:PREDICTED: uncharacterized protein LOC105853198 [Condylura cristata]|uniref:uncharacterized protein LOC105853198 n=1 Tax=Condylura cristata TaxID=143302 RepID=UPI00064317D3|nr:PREDICTED: uncharacterized protein LOC105853198 [Condylura cristata]XP_012576092.1 PREDICTED: uncharacterized protein LOC105853198 [Condylura cristata]
MSWKGDVVHPRVEYYSARNRNKVLTHPQTYLSGSRRRPHTTPQHAHGAGPGGWCRGGRLGCCRLRVSLGRCRKPGGGADCAVSPGVHGTAHPGPWKHPDGWSWGAGSAPGRCLGSCAPPDSPVRCAFGICRERGREVGSLALEVMAARCLPGLHRGGGLGALELPLRVTSSVIGSPGPLTLPLQARLPSVKSAASLVSKLCSEAPELRRELSCPGERGPLKPPGTPPRPCPPFRPGLPWKAGCGCQCRWGRGRRGGPCSGSTSRGLGDGNSRCLEPSFRLRPSEEAVGSCLPGHSAGSEPRALPGHDACSSLPCSGGALWSLSSGPGSLGLD